MFNSKRGISPLVATLLLVAFAVALGGVVMSWGQNLVEEGAAGHASCVDIDVKLTRDACAAGAGAAGYVDFVVDNDAPFSVNGLSVWIFGEAFDHSNIVKVTEISDIELKPGQSYVGHVLYDFTRFGTLNSVTIVPKVKQSGDYVLCHDNAITAEEIGSC